MDLSSGEPSHPSPADLWEQGLTVRTLRNNRHRKEGQYTPEEEEKGDPVIRALNGATETGSSRWSEDGGMDGEQI